METEQIQKNIEEQLVRQIQSEFNTQIKQTLEENIFYESIQGLCMVIVIVYAIFSWSQVFIPNYGYGKNSTKNRKIFTVSGKMAFVYFEIPNIFMILMFYSYIETLYNQYLLALFAIHYFQRTFMYPLKIQNAKPFPIEIVLAAAIYTTSNSFLICYNLYEETIKFEWISFIIGNFLFWTGLKINMQSDTILTSLKKKTDEYQIPTGGWFDHVTCANYFGEILEWIGYFILSQTYSSFLFMICCINFLVPKAINQHSWYHKTFKNYPKQRFRIFPKIF